MPFDGKDFALPAAETDEVLRSLMRARDMIANPDDWCCVEMRDGHRRCAFQALVDADACGALPWMRRAALAINPDGHGAVAGINVIYGHKGALEMYDRAIAARRKELGHA